MDPIIADMDLCALAAARTDIVWFGAVDGCVGTCLDFAEVLVFRGLVLGERSIDDISTRKEMRVRTASWFRLFLVCFRFFFYGHGI